MPPNQKTSINDITDNVTIKSETSIYDQLRPKNESYFLRKVRDVEKAMGFLTPLKWTNIVFLTLIHVVILTWLVYNLSVGKLPKWQTVIYATFLYIMGAFGVTGGVHRYWTHRCFEANQPLRILLAICFCMSGQHTIYAWVRDHRVHHKFSDTSADPHDASRGFFFSHMGWLMMLKHPDVTREGKKMDMSDIISDPIVQFQMKYYTILKLAFAFVLPIMVAPLMWGESWEQSILMKLFLVYIFALHSVWSVNSVAHLWGNKPYDPNIYPAENRWVSFFAIGEGWHNYHHKFPWDYKAAELPYTLNITTMLLDGFAALGWAKNMKRASPQLIQAARDKASRVLEQNEK